MPRTLYTNFIFGLSGEPSEMLVEDGRVLSRGPRVGEPQPQPSPSRAQSSRQGEGTKGVDAVDLGGKSLYPAFIDAHCHILPTGLDLGRLNLDHLSTPGEVLDAVRDALPHVEPGRWLRVVHYDQTKFPDGQHLTKADLDKISGSIPILLRHVNGHASVANSAALQGAGIVESVKDPPGGEFVRDEMGRLSGVLLERAHEKVTAAAPQPSLEQMVVAILLAGEKMAGFGICCAADMMTGQFDLEQELRAYRMAAEKGCPIRMALYLQWNAVFGPRAMPTSLLKELRAELDGERCRICGIKIFADGAIGSRTAAIYGDYAPQSNTQHQASDTRDAGQLIYTADRLKEMVRIAHEAGYQIAIHSIGDRSTDLVLDAYQALDNPDRHRIEHAMILSDPQIERMARLGIRCVMQPEFLLRFGHSYKRQLGPSRAATLKRFRSVMDAGIPLAFSSDRPIVAGDPRDGIEVATDRPEGFDASENISIGEAEQAYTVAASDAMFDGGLCDLAPGSRAEFRLEN